MWQRTKFGVAMGVVLVGVAVGIAFAAEWLSVRSIDDEVRVRLARGERLSSSRWGEVEKSAVFAGLTRAEVVRLLGPSTGTNPGADASWEVPQPMWESRLCWVNVRYAPDAAGVERVAIVKLAWD